MPARHFSSLFYLTALLVSLLSFSCRYLEKPGEPGTHEDFERFLEIKENRLKYQKFSAFFTRHGAHQVTPVFHLLRQGTDWKKKGLEPFAIPPRSQWKNMLPVLLFIRVEIIPLIGKVEIVSAYRSKAYNEAAGGAKRSKHLIFGGVDLVPQEPVSRSELHRILTKLWQEKGKKYRLGLGLYSRTRFHVDTYGYRRW